MTSSPSLGPTVRVAFDIKLGKLARAEGFTYDVDDAKLHAALVAGGLTETNIQTNPVVIKETDNPLEAGRCFIESQKHPYLDMRTGTHIELYTYGGKSEISTKIAAHEARHLADAIQSGPRALSEGARIIKKAALTAGVVALTAAYYYNWMRGNSALSVEGVEKGLYSAVLGYFSLTTILLGEYGLRKSERRARRAANQVVGENILVLESASCESVSVVPIPTTAFLRAGAMRRLIPDFRS
jgi:hypothetical protein